MTTAGETSLTTLLRTLTLSIRPAVYVWMTFDLSKAPPPPTLHALLSFRESEGVTIITTLDSARDHSYGESDYTFPCRMITCNVHSSLEAVGFMAKMSAVLAERGIGCNPVSGYFHDHLFVAVEKAELAMEALEGLATEAKVGTV